MTILIIAFTLCDLLLPPLELLAFLPDRATCLQAERINVIYQSQVVVQIEAGLGSTKEMHQLREHLIWLKGLWSDLGSAHLIYVDDSHGMHRRRFLYKVARELNWEHATCIEDLRLPLPVPVER